MTVKKTILVTGANGQLGNEMKVVSAGNTFYNFLFVTKEELAIDDAAAVNVYFSNHNIGFCVNCAAYTTVDKAETETEKAFLINAEAVGNLAKVCALHDAIFIHISTDYVFDGTATTPYKEDSTVHPVNLYGASKLKGEELARQNNAASIIIRTSWVYSSFGNNFVKTMLRLMSQREAISVVSDQRGSPTYAADLAAAILHIIDQLKNNKDILLKQSPPANIFNYSNKGTINWHEFASAIKELSGSKCIVKPIPASEYPTPAKRPAYSVMDISKIQQTFNLTIPEWRDSLENCLKLLHELHE